jgi:hypothetical protein
MHSPDHNTDAAYEDLYLREIDDDDDDIGNIRCEPSVLDIASGSGASDYDFTARTAGGELIRFDRAEPVGDHVILCEGVVTGMDPDERTYFNLLEIDAAALIWVAAKRKGGANAK